MHELPVYITKAITTKETGTSSLVCTPIFKDSEQAHCALALMARVVFFSAPLSGADKSRSG